MTVMVICVLYLLFNVSRFISPWFQIFTYKPALPEVNGRYEIRNSVFHLLVINHKFSEQSLKYCLILQLNMDQCFNITADKALRVSFYSFKVYLKNKIVGAYKELCEIANCHVCNIVKNA